VRQIAGTEMLPPYEFQYETTINLPYKTSHYIDYFGYFSTNASANMIKKIKSIFGKTTEYEYEKCNSGVRIKRIKDYDGVTLINTLRYEYIDGPLLKPIWFSGVPDVYITKTYTGPKCVWPDLDYSKVVESPYSYYKCKYSGCIFQNPTSFSDLTAIHPQQYSQITQFNGENGENGKIEYYYNTVTYNQPFYPFIPINRDILEGKLSRKKIFKNTSNIFTISSDEFYIYNVYQNNLTPSNGIKTYYDYTTNSVKLVGYIMNSNKLAGYTQTIYTYDTDNNNNYIQKDNVVVFDFNTNMLKQYTQQMHSKKTEEIYDNPKRPTIVRKTSKNISGTETYNDVSEIYSYDNDGNIITKSIKLPAQIAYPVSSSYSQQILKNTYKNGSLIQKDDLLEILASNDSPPVLAYKNNFSSTSFIWGYRFSYPIAVATNADISQIAHNNFEEGTLKGNSAWSVSPTTNVIIDKKNDPVNVFSGRFALKLNKPLIGSVNYSPYIFIKPITQKGKYKFSCWIKLSTGMTKDAFIEIKSTQTPAFGTATFPSIANAYKNKFANRSITDWQYIEVMIDLDELKLSAPTTDLYLGVVVANMDETKDIYVDDMRLHPVDAQMSTFTYKPGVGKTSEAGVDSKPVHFEYDTFGRIIYTKDFRKNILSKNQYFTK